MMHRGDHESDAPDISGMIGGTLRVKPGTKTVISAMINRDLVLASGVEAELTWMVQNNVYLNGGTLTGKGLIGGEILHEGKL
ncbi:hypothetical protein CEW89_01785 [Celeribacter ethanolicus]|uniref:Uncharacterized protein n=1 Tax=Celeribacter ethanolicus TaxID=1758178 RepID=A0A291G8B6_9RHOB|nr:hypothetical protein [Celeribacter ethanolicus]ATG46407.1 hypothetical protein CEW89_01785 [Celeribacter ethanolicus]